MAKKVLIEEVKQPQVEEVFTLKSDEFKVNLDSDTQTVKFELTDGTSVEMKSPKTRQFLLLESFMKSAEDEYKTESFMALKLASLCITKFGDKDKVSFDELLEIEIEDVERVAASLGCFRDKFEYLGRKSASI